MFIGLDCPLLPEPANGRIILGPSSCAVTEGCSITIDCDLGYYPQFAGNGSQPDTAAVNRTCMLNEGHNSSEWSGAEVTCVIGMFFYM